jgi:hypothetical protein
MTVNRVLGRQWRGPQGPERLLRDRPAGRTEPTYAHVEPSRSPLGDAPGHSTERGPLWRSGRRRLPASPPGSLAAIRRWGNTRRWSTLARGLSVQDPGGHGLRLGGVRSSVHPARESTGHPSVRRIMSRPQTNPTTTGVGNRRRRPGDECRPLVGRCVPTSDPSHPAATRLRGPSHAFSMSVDSHTPER